MTPVSPKSDQTVRKALLHLRAAEPQLQALLPASCGASSAWARSHAMGGRISRPTSKWMGVCQQCRQRRGRRRRCRATAAVQLVSKHRALPPHRSAAASATATASMFQLQPYTPPPWAAKIGLVRCGLAWLLLPPHACCWPLHGFCRCCPSSGRLFKPALSLLPPLHFMPHCCRSPSSGTASPCCPRPSIRGTCQACRPAASCTSSVTI